MQWDDEAVKIVDEIPLPPVVARFARMDAEGRARKKGGDRVTADIARETASGYEKTLGKEAVELLKAMARGEDVQLPDEFFVEEPDELYSIQLCPAQYGASTMEKREQMRRILPLLRAKLKELGITRILIDKATTSLMSHHAFRVGVTGCSNTCFSPYFLDFGVIGRYRQAIKAAGCTRCGECAAYCSEHAISLGDNGPVIDEETCVMCAGCAEVCPEGLIYTQEQGYKVVAGGTGARHPRIAETVTEFTDADGVIAILERAVRLMESTPIDGRVLSLRQVLKVHGVEKLRG